MLAEKILHFHRNLDLPKSLPTGVEVMNPFVMDETYLIAAKFYRKFYSDNHPRKLILGINPGRFGAGLTGVPFTDPIKLQEICGIENVLPRKPELSAEFIHQMIAAFGGVDVFFSQFYINSVFPLGFTKGGKNLNYYDQPDLQKIAEPYCVASIKTQLDFGLDLNKIFCLGEGQNFKFLNKLNDKHGFANEIIPLPHPRFIMQYRRKYIPQYIDLFLERLSS